MTPVPQSEWETHMSDDIDRQAQLGTQPHSQLFTLRLWRDAEQPQAAIPYIQVRHVLTGETRYYSTWPPLIDYVTNKLDAFYHPQEPSEALTEALTKAPTEVP